MKVSWVIQSEKQKEKIMNKNKEPHRLQNDFRNHGDKKPIDSLPKVLKEKECQPRTLYPVKQFFKSEKQMNISLENQEPRLKKIKTQVLCH